MNWVSLTARLLLPLILVPALPSAGGGQSRPRLTVDGSVGRTEAGDVHRRAAGPIVDINILHTSDEHGWLEPAVSPGRGTVQGGMANLFSWLVEFEGYDPDTFLLLSSGDNWTGPAVSTWFQGEPMVEAFNLMGYDAVAIGNHEFDFGRAAMIEQFAVSNAPYLGANVFYADTGEPADFARPFVIADVNSVAVGIVGLANSETCTCTHPLDALDLEFGNYAAALDQFVPRVREQGAEVVIVLAHACLHELKEAIRTMHVRVDAMFGAHCHKLFIDEEASIPLMGSGWAYRAYGRMTLRYNRETGSVVDHDLKLTRVEYPKGGRNPVKPDPLLSALVNRWRRRNQGLFNRKIGFTRRGIGKRDWAMVNWVADSWLAAFPHAHASIAIFGGFRQNLFPGFITREDIIGVLPFENELMEITLTGAELAENLIHGATGCPAQRGCYPGVGGIRYRMEGATIRVEFLDGTPVKPDGIYTVIVSDFLYYGGADFPLQYQDPHGIPTGVNYRDPVIAWMSRLASSPADPLETHIDPDPRNR